MCSRYELNASPRRIVTRFHLTAEPAELARPEVRPTDPAPIVLSDGGNGRYPRTMRFGMPVSWDKGPLLNARAETVAEKPTFRPLLERRCLVPASAYFEWRVDNRRRFKNRIALASERLIAFAGLHDGTHFMIVTCAPAPAIAHIHDRMPVVLSETDEAAWIDPRKSFRDVTALLAPYAAEPLSFAEETPPPPRQADLFG